MDRAANHRAKAERARQLADLAWQPSLKDTLRSLAKDYDEIAEDIETGSADVENPNISDLPISRTVKRGVLVWR
jgi:hypothetical protein